MRVPSKDQAASPIGFILLALLIVSGFALAAWVWLSGYNMPPLPLRLSLYQSNSVHEPNACDIMDASWCVQWVIIDASPNLRFDGISISDERTRLEMTCRAPTVLKPSDIITCHGHGAGPRTGDVFAFRDSNNLIMWSGRYHA